MYFSQSIRGEYVKAVKASEEGGVVETLVKMFKQKKKIGQLINGKNYKVPLNSDLVTFFNDKNAQKL